MKNLKHLLGLALVAAVSLLPSVHAGDSSAKILPPHSHPFGTTYAQLAADWWTWALSMPFFENPLTDSAPWDAEQDRGKIMFLANEFISGTYERTITVPNGTAFFFPLANAFWLTVDPENEPSDEPTIRAILAEVMDQTTDLSLEIDGQPVTDLDRYRTQSVLFEMDSIPGNLLNIVGIPEGHYRPAVDEGWYILLAPLSVGHHTIHFTSNIPFFPTVLDITYHITVVGGKK